MQMEYSAKMDAEEEKKRAESRKVKDRQVRCCGHVWVVDLRFEGSGSYTS